MDQVLSFKLPIEGKMSGFFNDFPIFFLYQFNNRFKSFSCVGLDYFHKIKIQNLMNFVKFCALRNYLTYYYSFTTFTHLTRSKELIFKI